MEYIMWILIDFVLIGAIILISVGYLIQRQAEIEVKKLYQGLSSEHIEVVKEEDLAVLPAPVQKWLRSSGVVGKEKIQKARLKQKGQMRTEPEAKWMPFTAVQYFNFAEPGFLWYAKIKANALVHITGKDKYVNGKGNMLIKILSLFKVSDASGSEINQGSLVRYLAEIVSQPTAALSSYIQWEAVNEQSVRATMNYRGVTATGVFEFDQQGDVVSFSAPRYREHKGNYTLDDWYIKAYGHKEFQGIRIPAQGEVIWKLPEGDFNWFQFEVIEVNFN